MLTTNYLGVLLVKISDFFLKWKVAFPNLAAQKIQPSLKTIPSFLWIGQVKFSQRERQHPTETKVPYLPEEFVRITRKLPP